MRLIAYVEQNEQMDSAFNTASLDWKYNSKLRFYILTIKPETVDSIKAIVIKLAESSYKN